MKKLNLGCGSKIKEGFVNLDKYNTFKPDIFTFSFFDSFFSCRYCYSVEK